MLALHRTVEITPRRPLAPGVGIFVAIGVDDLAAFFGVHAHAVRHADAQAGILFITHHRIAVRGDQVDVHINDPRVAFDHESHHAFLGDGLLAFGGHIVRIGFDDRRGAAFQRAKAGVLDAAQQRQGFRLGLFAVGGLLRPGVGAIDALVTKVQPAMMRMVLLLARHVLHRISPRHGFACGAVDRPEVRLVRLIDDVFGKGLPIHLHHRAARGRLRDGEFGGESL